jgi:hypothetical protein
MGGYVMGDGDCPFNPDDFMMLFMDRMVDAARKGMEELCLSDLEIEAAITAQKQAVRDDWDNAEEHVFLDGTTPQVLLEAMGD